MYVSNLIKFYSKINTICVFKVYLKSGFGGHIKRNYFVSLRSNVIQIVRFVPKRNSVTKRPRTVPRINVICLIVYFTPLPFYRLIRLIENIQNR